VRRYLYTLLNKTLWLSLRLAELQFRLEKNLFVCNRNKTGRHFGFFRRRATNQIARKIAPPEYTLKNYFSPNIDLICRCMFPCYINTTLYSVVSFCVYDYLTDCRPRNLRNLIMSPFSSCINIGPSII
jgi:hypothetical protein